jgi:alpha-tubulin suppressor-like RCC1 family protein
MVQVSAGGSFACAIGDDGAVRCWGDNGLGQAGVPNAAGVLVPRRVPVVAGAKEIATGTQHACALTDDGRVFCWGNNGDGIVTGAPDATPHPNPTQVTLPKTATHIAAWSDHVCAIVTGGDLYCWGANDYGQCGVGATDGGSPPLTVPKPSRVTGGVNLVGGAEEVTCVVTGAGMSCLGRNFSGQLAIGSSDFNPHPTLVPSQGVASTIAQITRSNGYHLAIALADGRVQAWGSNADSAVTPNDGGTYEVTKPTLVAGVSGIAETAAGAYFTCARKGDGSVWCWGDNASGQMGSAASVTDQPTPRAVPNVSGASQITAGRSGFVCALANGRVSCWGENGHGELGRGKVGGNSPDPTVIRFDE